MKWFKHSTNSGMNAKLRKLLIKYGVQGYGLYYYCVELIAGNFSNDNITFELEHDSQILAYDLKMDSSIIEEIMKYCIKLNLFEINPVNQKIIYIGLLDELDNTMSQHPSIKALKMSENFKLLKDNLNNLKQNRIESNPSESNPKEDKQTQYLKQRPFVKPTGKEVQDYLDSLDFKYFTGDYFVDRNDATGWVVGKNRTPMKDWKATVRTWINNHKMREKEKEKKESIYETIYENGKRK
jgi:hypothetical protein